jgi:hypothetical protein
MRFSTRHLFILLVLLAIFTMATRNIADPDFWWHLRTGQLIAESHTIPKTDPFSFTKSGTEWVTHEWLAELIIFKLYEIGRFALLIFSFAAMITGSFAFVYARCVGKPYIAGFFIIIGLIALAPVIGVRPQIFTILLGSLFLYFLDRYVASNQRKFLYAIPLLMILWVNLHSGYALGIAIVFIYIIAEVISIVIMKIGANNSDVEISITHIKYLVSVFLLTCIAVVINPNGIRMYSYPFTTLTSPAMQNNIQEWFSPNFHLPYWQPFALLLILALAFGMLLPSKISITHAIGAVFFGYAALRSARNVPFFVITIIPILCLQLDSFIQKIWGKAKSISVVTRSQTVINSLIAFLFLFVILIRLVFVAGQQQKTERESYPERAANWIVSSHPEANIFNAYEWGGYLIWRLYPEYRIFIDGRADVYGDDFIEQYLGGIRGEQNIFVIMDKYDINTIIVPKDSRITTNIGGSPQWSVAYQDELAIIYIRK